MSATSGNDCSRGPAGLYVALELGLKEWKMASTVGLGQKPRIRTLPARGLAALWRELATAKQRFGLSPEAAVFSCYEAGRDGFWLDRVLRERGVQNVVVDSSSIEVNRRKRRAKTDRLDAQKLVTMLLRYHWGEAKLWSVLRIPSLEEEDQRHLHRELLAVKGERTRHINRIKGLLISVGIALPTVDTSFPEDLERLRLWWASRAGTAPPLPAALRERCRREYERLALAERQIRDLEEARLAQIGSSSSPAMETVRQLMKLRGIGPAISWLLTMECLAWRKFANRRELASMAGLTPTPYSSSQGEREQGISKAGNRRLRTMLVELAWGWLVFQPESALSRWYAERFGSGSQRQRKIGIVALARKLWVALWRYVETGEVPEGAAVGDWEEKVPRRLRTAA